MLADGFGNVVSQIDMYCARDPVNSESTQVVDAQEERFLLMGPACTMSSRKVIVE